MIPVHSLLLFISAALVLLVIPGPAVFYILGHSIGHGRKAGIVSALGIGVGSIFHTAAAAVGLSALLLSSAVALGTVKYLGAAYLIYLGIQKLRRDESTDLSAGAPQVKLSRVFAQGIVVNILNPKAALFFFAFLPQFVDTSRGSVPFQVVVLGAAFVLLGLLSDGAYALLASTGAGWLRRRPRVARRSRLVSGGVLISLGVTTALAGSRSSTR